MTKTQNIFAGYAKMYAAERIEPASHISVGDRMGSILFTPDYLDLDYFLRLSVV